MQEALFKSSQYQESLQPQATDPAEKYQSYYENLDLSTNQQLIPARWIRPLWREVMQATDWYQKEYAAISLQDFMVSRYPGGDYHNLKTLTDNYQQLITNNPSSLHHNIIRAEISSALHSSTERFFNTVSIYRSFPKLKRSDLEENTYWHLDNPINYRQLMKLPGKQQRQTEQGLSIWDEDHTASMLLRSLNNICYEHLFHPHAEAVQDKYNFYQDRVDYKLTIYELAPSLFLLARDLVLTEFSLHWQQKLRYATWDWLEPTNSCAILTGEFRKTCQEIIPQILQNEYQESLNNQLLNEDWQSVGNIYNNLTTFALQSHWD